jgi:glycosyltransferase involved in cell wall biosynthesis
MLEHFISAIIPVYNGRRFLREAVESVIAQTLPPTELILVDDGSTDDSLSILDDIEFPFPVTKIHQENTGQSAARNNGAAIAKGEYIALLDQDDIWYPRHLEKLVKPFLKDDGRLGWSYSNWAETDEYGLIVRQGYLDGLSLQNPKRDLFHLLGAGVIIQPGATLIRKAAFNGVGGFDPKLSGYEDDDLFLRIFRRGWTNAFIPESLSTWRIYWSSSQFTVRTRESRRYYAEKLMTDYPNDPGGMRCYVRDCLAPRFTNIALEEYNRALTINRWDICKDVIADAIKYANRTDYNHIGRKTRASFGVMSRPRLYKRLHNLHSRLPYILRRLISL